MVKKISYGILALFIFACSSSDSNEEIPDEISLPSVSTANPTNVTENSATVGGSVANDGGANITERGIVWGLTSNPTIVDNKKSSGSGMGDFSVSLTDLDANSQYYIRAYAINSKGTAYGNQQQFTTEEGEPVQKIYEGDVLLTSQGEVNDFGAQNYTEITGTLTIKDSNSPTSITNLEALKTLQTIDVDLRIEYNDLLENLGGLENLTRVGGEILIYGQALLRDIDELSEIKSARVIQIVNNLLLENLDGIENIEEIVASFIVLGNPSLKEIDGFDNIEQLSHLLFIEYNDNLESISGFQNLITMDAGLSIEGNPKITTIEGFKKLQRAGTITIVSNDLLESVDAFPSLTSLGAINGFGLDSGLNIAENNSLTSIEGFPLLEEIEGKIRIYRNPQLAQVSGFPNLITLGQELNIDYNDVLVSIGGFESLETMKGFTTHFNGSLEGISGFSSLQIVEESISFNASSQNSNLKSLMAFTSLKAVRKSFFIIGFKELENLDILSNLEEVGDLVIEDNPKLLNIDGLNNIETIDGHLIFINNQLLNDITGLSNLKNINGDLKFSNQNQITSLEGLNSLTSIQEYLIIEFNPNLNNLDSLESLANVGELVQLIGNQQLNDFCGLTTLFENGWADTYTVYGNLYNPTFLDISDGNCSN